MPEASVHKAPLHATSSSNMPERSTSARRQHRIICVTFPWRTATYVHACLCIIAVCVCLLGMLTHLSQTMDCIHMPEERRVRHETPMKSNGWHIIYCACTQHSPTRIGGVVMHRRVHNSPWIQFTCKCVYMCARMCVHKFVRAHESYTHRQTRTRHRYDDDMCACVCVILIMRWRARVRSLDLTAPSRQCRDIRSSSFASAPNAKCE